MVPSSFARTLSPSLRPSSARVGSSKTGFSKLSNISLFFLYSFLMSVLILPLWPFFLVVLLFVEESEFGDEEEGLSDLTFGDEEEDLSDLTFGDEEEGWADFELDLSELGLVNS